MQHNQMKLNEEKFLEFECHMQIGENSFLKCIHMISILNAIELPFCYNLQLHNDILK